MSIFATKSMEEIKGVLQTFDKLVVDNICLLDKFESEIKENKQYVSEYQHILLYMNSVANGQSLPESKFREIKGKNNILKRYEFKSKHLRVYAFKNKNGKIIVIGGYKNTQKLDIAKLNKLAHEFTSHQ